MRYKKGKTNKEDNELLHQNFVNLGLEQDKIDYILEFRKKLNLFGDLEISLIPFALGILAYSFTNSALIGWSSVFMTTVLILRLVRLFPKLKTKLYVERIFNLCRSRGNKTSMEIDPFFLQAKMKIS